MLARTAHEPLKTNQFVAIVSARLGARVLEPCRLGE